MNHGPTTAVAFTSEHDAQFAMTPTDEFGDGRLDPLPTFDIQAVELGTVVNRRSAHAK